MRVDRTDEIINYILQLRLDMAKMDVKLDHMFREIENAKTDIPKKVIRQHEEPTEEEIKELADLNFCGGDVIRCPNCNEYIVVDRLKYCMECGQRLDWD